MPHWVIPAFYSMRAAAAGLIGYCTCYTNPSFAPVGGAARVLGNNPLSYAIPADPRPPIVVDFGVSASTGRMRELIADGQPLPDGWAVDAAGQPLRDPAQAMADGVFLPVAEHRGYGLGLVHELLAASLNAMPIALETPPGRYGGFFMAWRVDTFRPRDATSFCATSITLSTESQAACPSIGPAPSAIPASAPAWHYAVTSPAVRSNSALRRGPGSRKSQPSQAYRHPNLWARAEARRPSGSARRLRRWRGGGSGCRV